MYQRSLDCVLEIIAATLSQGRQYTCKGCPNIRAQKHWITGFELCVAHANHWCQSGGEDRT